MHSIYSLTAGIVFGLAVAFALRRLRRALWWHRYRKYLRSPEWQLKRWQTFNRADGRCEICGEKITGSFQAHHVSYRHLGYERPGELMCVHPWCHPLKWF